MWSLAFCSCPRLTHLTQLNTVHKTHPFKSVFNIYSPTKPTPSGGTKGLPIPPSTRQPKQHGCGSKSGGVQLKAMCQRSAGQSVANSFPLLMVWQCRNTSPFAANSLLLRMNNQTLAMLWDFSPWMHSSATLRSARSKFRPSLIYMGDKWPASAGQPLRKSRRKLLKRLRVVLQTSQKWEPAKSWHTQWCVWCLGQEPPCCTCSSFLL